jgi:hypothetical protein
LQGLLHHFVIKLIIINIRLPVKGEPPGAPCQNLREIIRRSWGLVPITPAASRQVSSACSTNLLTRIARAPPPWRCRRKSSGWCPASICHPIRQRPTLREDPLC